MIKPQQISEILPRGPITHSSLHLVEMLTPGGIAHVVKTFSEASISHEPPCDAIMPGEIKRRLYNYKREEFENLTQNALCIRGIC